MHFTHGEICKSIRESPSEISKGQSLICHAIYSLVFLSSLSPLTVSKPNAILTFHFGHRLNDSKQHLASFPRLFHETCKLPWVPHCLISHLSNTGRILPLHWNEVDRFKVSVVMQASNWLLPHEQSQLCCRCSSLNSLVFTLLPRKFFPVLFAFLIYLVPFPSWSCFSSFVLLQEDATHVYSIYSSAIWQLFVHVQCIPLS